MPNSILVVDDKANVRSLIQDYLSEQGFRVLTACNGREALFVARQEKPDLILLDIPVMDGLSAIEILKTKEDTKSIPIIVLTSFAMAGDKERVFLAEADDFFNKANKN